ncbi:MAG TPA: preprotein translocase subunit YajC [Gaiellaceae bacterium]|nr:preprotein translocase subunit YajC [Gaiellaceae bacterium]
MDSGFILFFVLMLGVLYVLLIRPQRQQARRHQDMLASLKVGDEVVTAGGIYGEVTAIDEDRVQLEVDADVKIAVARRAIASVVPPDESEPGEGEPEADEGVTAEEPEPVPEEKART